MKTLQILKNDTDAQPGLLNQLGAFAPDVILLFWGEAPLAAPQVLTQIQALCPNTPVIGCSSSGDIHRKGIVNDGWIINAIRFEHAETRLEITETEVTHIDDSRAAGVRLTQSLSHEHLQYVFVLSPGVLVDGAQLIHGASETLPDATLISGGMAGDNGEFEQTFVLGPSGIAENRVVALAFYGPNLNVASGSRGGWRPFGPKRKITKSEGCHLYEIDGQPALTLYEKYLGDYAKDLPASALFFPMELLDNHMEPIGLIRTIQAIDAKSKSICLAGSVTEGDYIRFMLASPDMIVEGSEEAIAASLINYPCTPELILCVSCVGRKLIMGQRIYEEILILNDHLNDQFTTTATIAGFYSNGEFGCTQAGLKGQLHNETMSITVMAESLS